MQRRPLAVDPDERHFTTPSERFIWASMSMGAMYGVHGGFQAWQYMQTLPSFHVETIEPVYTAATPDDFFKQMGFPHAPVNYDFCRDEYPKQPPQNAHPLCYLKWGAQLFRSNHLVFELGELYYLVTVDMKKVNGDPQKPWQIDALIVKNGTQKNYIPCDLPEYKHFADRVLNAVAKAVTELNNDRDIYAATKVLQNDLHNVLKDIESVAVDFNPDHDPKMGIRSKTRPFTP